MPHTLSTEVNERYYEVVAERNRSNIVFWLPPLINLLIFNCVTYCCGCLGWIPIAKNNNNNNNCVQVAKLSKYVIIEQTTRSSSLLESQYGFLWYELQETPKDSSSLSSCMREFLVSSYFPRLFLVLVLYQSIQWDSEAHDFTAFIMKKMLRKCPECRKTIKVATCEINRFILSKTT